jgi:spermidine/putrescine transport system substrate-binding protein
MARSLPEDPLIRSLVLQARRAQVSRRSILGGASIGATALALAACSPAGNTKPTAAADTSATDKVLNWSNWTGYMDEDDDKNHPTLDRFEEETGIKVAYNEVIDDNNTYYGGIKDQLALGKDVGADIVVFTDWMASRVIRFGYAQELDHANIPNIKNLDPGLLNVDYDDGRKFSLPWQGGYAGLCWNMELLPDGLKSVDDLWDPELKGKVGVLSEMRDTLGLIMAQNGVDISSDWGEAEFNAALDVFKEKVTSGQIRNVKGNSYTNDLANGDTLAAIVWSGDVVTLNADYDEPKFGFAIPEAGGTLWYDNSLVPIGSPHKTNAETLLNYYYDPEIAAELAAWVNYVTPVVGAKEAAVAIDPELAENQLIFPDEDTLSQVKVFRSLSGAEEQTYQAAFQSVLLGA